MWTRCICFRGRQIEISAGWGHEVRAGARRHGGMEACGGRGEVARRNTGNKLLWHRDDLRVHT